MQSGDNDFLHHCRIVRRSALVSCFQVIITSSTRWLLCASASSDLQVYGLPVLIRTIDCLSLKLEGVISLMKTYGTEQLQRLFPQMKKWGTKADKKLDVTRNP